MLNQRLATLMQGNAPAWAIGADLWSDFTKSNRLTITDTHAATIYAPNAAGVYNPYTANVLTRTDLGLQTVPTRTNLALRSQEFDNATAWTLFQLNAITANSTAAPDGTTTADTLIPAANSGTHKIDQTMTSTVATYTGSFYVKATGSYHKVGIREDAVSGSYATFDMVGAGTVIASGAGGSGTITALANGWYWITMTYTGTAASHRLTLYLMDNSYASGSPHAYNWTGDGTTGYYVWQGQYELGAFASPPIVTTTTSATVNGNQPVASNFGSQLVTGVAGLVQVDIKAFFSFGDIWGFNDGTGNNDVRLYVTTAGALNFKVNAGGVSQVDTAIATGLSTGIHTVAYCVKQGSAFARRVGSSNVALTGPASWPVMDRATFGGNGFNASDNTYQFMRKRAEDFLTAGDDFTAKSNEWYNKAVLAAAT